MGKGVGTWPRHSRGAISALVFSLTLLFTLCTAWLEPRSAQAATVTYTYTFTGSSESWTSVGTGGGSFTTGTWAPDSLETTISGKNKTNASTGWEISGITWESLGVPAGAVVTAVDGSYAWLCSAYATGAASGSGDLTVTDAADGNATTLETGVTFSSTTTLASRNSNGPISIPGVLQPSTSSIKIRLLGPLATGNNNSAAVTRVNDTVSLTITYTVPPVLASPAATGIGSTSATLGATISSGTGIIARGTVWDTTTAPTANQLAEGGTATGAFSHARSGLPAGTRVFYRGYADNGGIGYSPTGSFYTEPATQASAVNFSGISSTGMTVNWTRGSGNEVIVLLKAASAVSGVPTDGTYSAYGANTTYGSGTLITDGYVVYKGTGTSVAVTGLAASTTYHVAVFEYAGAVDTAGVDLGTNYKPTPAAGSQATSAAADATPPTIGIVNVSPTSGIYTSSAPTITATATDGESTVTGCEYTTNGTNWLAAAFAAGTCTATPSGLSGALTVNIRATSTGGTAAGTAVNRTVDATGPTDGAPLVVTPGDQQNTLSWSAASDSVGIQQYDVRFVTGTTPPASCAAGTSIYTGSNTGYLHGSLTNDQDYAYRVCAYDTFGNVSTGLTGTGRPTGVVTPQNTVSATSAAVAAAATDSAKGVVMQRLTVSCDTVSGAPNKLVLSSLALDDAGSATGVAAVKIYLAGTSSDTLPTTALLVGGQSRWDGAATTLPLTGGTDTARTVTAGTPKYLYIVYDMAYGQSGNSVRSHVTGVGVAAPAISASGLNLSANSITLSAGSSLAAITDCSGCHGYPPVDGTARNNPARAVVGSHTPHGGNTCADCHIVPATTTSADFDHRNGLIELVLDFFSYTKGASFSQTNDLDGSGLGTCGSACHNVYGATTAGSLKWGVAGSGCADCHSVSIGATGPATGSHTLAGHSTACTTCHAPGTAQGSAPAAGHADGDIDVVNVGYPANVAKHAAGSGYSSCSAASCHANVYGSGTITTPAWGATGSGCAACHSVAIDASGPATGGHTLAGHSAACTTCHAAGTAQGSVPSTGHADGDIDVANVGYPANVAKHAAGSGYSTCSAASCHANVYGSGTTVTPAWGSTGSGCGACHSVAIATTGPATGSHAAHNVTDCAQCHSGATTNASVPSANHADGNIDVTNGYPANVAKHAAGTYSGTCSTASCHANVYGSGTSVTPTWGSTGNGCSACHSVAIGASGPATGGHTLVGHNAACTACHAGGTAQGSVPSTGHADGNIDVANVGYPANVTKHAAGSGYATCTAASCHPNVYGTGSATTPTWGSTGSGCSACHSVAIGATGPATGSHTIAGHNAACTTCHAAGTAQGTAPSTGHVDGNIDTANVGYPANVAKHAAGSGYSTCSAASCHANVYGTGTIASPTWGSTGNGCSACHSIAIGATGPATGGHTLAAHNTACTACHATGTAQGTVPASGHADGNIDTANVGYPANVTKHAAGSGYATCTAASCHPNVYGTGSATTPTWGSTGNGCSACHSIAIGATGPATGSHTVAGHNTACTTCHAAGTAQGTAPSTGHVDGNIDTANVGYPANVTKHAAGSGYSSCSSASCHANVYGTGTIASPTWGSTGNGCAACHSAKPITATGPATGAHAKHMGLAGAACTKCHSTGTTATTVPSAGHADGNVDVTGGYPLNYAKHAFGSGYSTCNATYCHSTGQSTTGGATPVYATSPNWGSTGTTCASCHKNMDTDAAAPGNHVIHAQTNAIACASCHNGYTETTVAAATHVNSSIDLSFSGTLATGTVYSQGSSHAAGNGFGTCSSSYCHSSGQSATGGATPVYATPTWGATGSNCGSCHQNMDSNASAPGDHVKHAQGTANIACAVCHSGYSETTVAASTHINKVINLTFSGTGTGTTYSQGSSAAGDGYGSCSASKCHGQGAPVWGGALFSATVFCENCHGSAATNPFYSTAATGAAPTKTTTATDAKVGAHTIHLNSATTGLSANIACSECHPTVNLFTDAGHADGTTTFSWGTLARTGSLNPVYNSPVAGKCNNVYCHGGAMPGGDNTGSGRNPLWSDTTYIAALDATTCGRCHGFPPSAASGHPAATAPSSFPTTNCNCHDNISTSGTTLANIFVDKTKHINGIYEPAASGCKGCHGSGSAKDVETEFAKNSHHVNKTWAAMSDADCVVCHAEGSIASGGTVSVVTTRHGNDTVSNKGIVDLYDADNRATIYTITLSHLTMAAGTATEKNTANASLDIYCMSCHDSNGGAAITAANNFPSGYSPTNPFGETTNIRTNAYDTTQKSFTANGGGLNVKDDFSTTETGDPDGDSKRENHHAVRGARYTTATLTNPYSALRQASLLSSTVALFSGTTGISDNSTLHCNDCHSTAFSSHGGANEYMLQTNTASNPAGEHTATTYVCFKCHPSGSYGGSAHVGNGSDQQHTSDQVGSARMTGMGHMSGLSCLNCHDGGIGWGGIHGFQDATYVAGPEGTGGQGTYNKRRFLPGSGLRYYDPADTQAGGDADWSYVDGKGKATNKCYTLTNTTNMSACNKHGTGTGLAARNARRPVDY